MSNSSLEPIRHSLAHLLARAVLEHFPDAKLTLGPAIDTGFYYDIDFSGQEFSSDDFSDIKKTMNKLLAQWEEFKKLDVSSDQARKIFAGNKYKLELIEEITAAGDDISLYYSGPAGSAPEVSELTESGSVSLENGGFIDLCRGGHVENPSADIPSDAFALDSVAGAYWRGDEKNEMLTRIYGLAFENAQELEKFKKNREAAQERDHRKLGKELDLFTFSDLVGSGLPLFTPRGTAMRQAITDKIDEIQAPFDYQKVTIPHLSKPALYEQSGHWEKFGEELFHVQGMDNEFVIKPMNCPHHTQIYASQLRSYRDLPLRLVENTMVYRDEQSGELSGLSRVRSITQDDGHVFCTPEGMEEEIDTIVTVIEEFYRALGMWQAADFWVSLSVRDPDTPEAYLGDAARWDEAESDLKKAADTRGLEVKTIPGEAAFYGPKLDFMFFDALEREWQLATIQLDFVMPERFDLEYTAESGERVAPVMIHRAITGSLERFMAVAIEHFGGDFPFWLAPTQIALLPVADEHQSYAQEIARELKTAGYRTTIVAANDSLGKRIRNLHQQMIPTFGVIGDDEVDSQTLSLEARTDDKEIVIKQDQLAADLPEWLADLE
jgi:threonyl-tRNA synthetase